MTAVGVYVKYPLPGKVKTRLAATIGPERAAMAYVKMTGIVLGEVLSALPRERFDVTLYCDPFMPRPDYEAHFAEFPYSIAMQSGADLGERLARSLGEMLSRHDSAIAIGTDCVALRPSHLIEAAEQLAAGADLVLGPALDGGYYLIGMKKPHAALFEGIAWSTGSVLAQTIERALKLGLRVRKLEPLPDIDTEADLLGAGI